MAHCHQKALAGTAASVRLLSLIPGSVVVEVDGGCCGMAGSFGFEAEHYDLSMRIGGMRLFPAVNSEDPRTLVAATGVSCRQQIEHGTGRRALAPLGIHQGGGSATPPGRVLTANLSVGSYRDPGAASATSPCGNPLRT